jgi:hypothetical protein
MWNTKKINKEIKYLKRDKGNRGEYIKSHTARICIGQLGGMRGKELGGVESGKKRRIRVA